MKRPRLILLRGYQANPWDLRPWEELQDELDILLLEPHKNLFDTSLLTLDRKQVWTVRDLLPSGRGGDIAGHLIGDRYLGVEKELSSADIVHAAELSYWFSAQVARDKSKHGFKLALTIWETLPFLDTYRNRVRTRSYRHEVLGAADLLLPTTGRARAALLLEGVPESKIKINPPGIDLQRFAVRPSAEEGAESQHLILSVGRLVWEKGHQDILRALSALHKKIVATDSLPRLMIVGSGPEGDRLRTYAQELGIAEHVEFCEHLSYDKMPEIYSRASCLVLASLSIPKWEEQFGMVLVEAMASGLPIVAASSGAIPEVVGAEGMYFSPGDWLGLAQALSTWVLSKPAGSRQEFDAARISKFSVQAAAARLRSMYADLLSQ